MRHAGLSASVSACRAVCLPVFVVVNARSCDIVLLLGVIDVEALGFVMKAVGLEPSEAELHNMITEVDGSGNFEARLVHSCSLPWYHAFLQ